MTERSCVAEDLSTYDNHTGSAYQFMSGDWLLVAPVYRNATTRDGIYLPAGDWYDWWDDTVYHGPMTLDGYPAPLDTLPLFARAGAIIPQIPYVQQQLCLVGVLR